MKNSKFINGRSPKITKIVLCHNCNSLGVDKVADMGVYMCGVATSWVYCRKCNAYCEWAFRTTVSRKDLSVEQENMLPLLQRSYRLNNGPKIETLL